MRPGESQHPLPVLHREKSPKLAALGNGNRTCGVGRDKTFGNIPRSRDDEDLALVWW